MFSSTLEIKRLIHPSSLPPQCDFILPGYNTLLYAANSHFKNDFAQLKKEFGFSSIELNLYDCTPPKLIYGPSPWARDFISCKTRQKAFVMKSDIPLYNYSDVSIVIYNSNIASSILGSTEYLYKFNSKIFSHESTNIISAGGNIFHCVNAVGKSYAIVGEVGLASQMKPDLSWDIWNQIMFENPKTGSKSLNKYHYPPDVWGEWLVKRREWNKKILKTQLGKDTNLVIVPNSLWHIDVQMAILPNGVVLLHSFDKTLELLDKYKDKIPKYNDLYKKTQELARTSQPLFDKAKRKLEKRNFIVKEICGFITETDDHEGIIICGLNSLVGVSQTGKIFYTLLSDNPEWYLEDLKKELLACGVSMFYYISNQNSLKILRNEGGSIRCQHNTIPTHSLLFNPKKRPRNEQYELELPEAKKRQLSFD